jgi:hypothetical protein
LHVASFAYPTEPDDEHKRAILQLFDSLRLLLPCLACKFHWTQHLREHPPRVDSRLELIEYCLDAHNHVSRKLGKSEWTLQQLFAHYGEQLFDREVISTKQAEQREKKETARQIQDADQRALTSETARADAAQRLEECTRRYEREHRAVRDRSTQLAIAVVISLLMLAMIPVILKLAEKRRRRAEVAGAV